MADHDIVPGPMTLIWAKGTTTDAYSPPNGNSVFMQGLAGDANFFANNVLKYHGSKNRGSLTIDFFGSLRFSSATSSDCRDNEIGDKRQVDASRL